MRYVAPFLLPCWLFGWPAALYYRGRLAGTLPSEAEWQSAGSSSAPWQHDVLFVFAASVLVALMVYPLAWHACVREGQASLARWWATGALAAVLAVALSCWCFGYLMV